MPGLPYRLGDGPEWILLPTTSYCSMAFPFEGTIREAYYAGMQASAQTEELKFMMETGIEKAERMGLL